MVSRLVPMPSGGFTLRRPVMVVAPQPPKPDMAAVRAVMRENLPFLHTLVDAPLLNRHPGIYQIVLMGTERTYVGSGMVVGVRLRSHAKALVTGTHSNAKLQNAWRQHGADRFRYRVLERLDDDEELLAKREQHWIDHYQAADVGLNILPTVGRKKPVAPLPPPKQGSWLATLFSGWRT